MNITKTKMSGKWLYDIFERQSILYDGDKSYNKNYNYIALQLELYGLGNWPNNHEELFTNFPLVNMFYALYKGLWLMGIESDTIDKYQKSNRLDELMDESYKTRKSGYYDMYKKRGVMIGKTYL